MSWLNEEEPLSAKGIEGILACYRDGDIDPAASLEYVLTNGVEHGPSLEKWFYELNLSWLNDKMPWKTGDGEIFANADHESDRAPSKVRNHRWKGID
jgi:hypothetical protein